MKTIWKSLAVVVMSLGSYQALALTIDTNATWDGSINSGWAGSGQSLTVDATENVLDSIGFYFAGASHGLTFDFYLFDALNGGNTLFSTSFTVDSSAINVINVGVALTPGSKVWAEIDYLGFTGQTAHFSYVNGYAGGTSLFGPLGSMQGEAVWAGLDHRFVAEFSTGVPEPAGLALLGLGLAGLALRRKQG